MLPSPTTTSSAIRLNSPGRLTMRTAIHMQKARSALTPASAVLNLLANTFSLRTSSTPNTGTSSSTASSAMTVAANPASPKARIKSELENCSARNEMPAVA